jgi:nucleotide-binding universal stress UspA family protein
MTAENAMTIQSAPVSLKNILLATDFGAVSQIALQRATVIARRYDAKLYLLNVVRPSDQRGLEDAWREAQRYMTDQFIAGQFDGIDNRLLVEAGDTWEVISRKIDELGIDLIVTGAHARTGITKLLLGSTAETIFRQAPCPVLLVGSNTVPEPPPALQHILFCTGFSSHSLKAGGYALALAERQNACLKLLHVVIESPASEKERADLAASCEARLRSLLPGENSLSCPPEFSVAFGPSAENILRVAAQSKTDLIVLGVRQPAGFARRFKWATAYEVVTQATCPVLTVRSTEPA